MKTDKAVLIIDEEHAVAQRGDRGWAFDDIHLLCVGGQKLHQAWAVASERFWIPEDDTQAAFFVRCEKEVKHFRTFMLLKWKSSQIQVENIDATCCTAQYFSESLVVRGPIGDQFGRHEKEPPGEYVLNIF